MPVSRITQRFVDDLLGAEAPATDEFYWSERMPGFGVKHRAGSGSVSYVVQWREKGDRSLGKSHRLSLGNARPGQARRGRESSEGPAGRGHGRQEPDPGAPAVREAPTFRGLIDTYLAVPSVAEEGAQHAGADRNRIHVFLLPALGRARWSTSRSATSASCTATCATPPRPRRWRARPAPTRRRRGGEGGARRTMRLLKAILAFAVEEFDLPENPAAKLKLGADGEREAVPDPDAYGRLWAAIEKLRGTLLHDGRAPATASP